MSSDVATSMIGKMVGDYQIVSLLGEGGMGVVFKGVHAILGQTVAIKMLQPDLMKNESVKSRFVREAQALARLNHPNMVSLYNFIPDHEDGCFIIMEFTEGRDIEKHMEERGLIPPELCCEWFEQVLAAMGYAHNLNIIHRDIKPSNIMVTTAGPVKVLDFGTAKVLDAPALTKAGMTLGTVIYMPPEQLLGKTIDNRSDIYSLGVTLYEMCTGRLPFEDQKEMELVKKIARADPTPPTAHYPYLPKRMEQIILKAMAKKPDDRYQSADEFLVDLRDFHQELIGAKGVVPRSVTTTEGMAAAPMGGTMGAMTAAPEPVMAASVPATPASGPGAGVFLGAAGALFVLAILSGVVIYVAAGSGLVAGIVGGLFFLLALGVGAFGLMKANQGGKAPTPAALPVAPPVAAPVIMPAQPAPMPMPVATGAPNGFLIVMEGHDKGQKYPLTAAGVSIGRGEQNTIPLNDPGVSTVHAQIVLNGQQWVLQDLGSRNGCYVNNQKVTQHVLSHNDVVVFGSSMLVVNLQ